MKTCTFCKEEKPLSLFSKNKTKKDGLQNKCKPCSAAKLREYYAADPKQHYEGTTKRKRKLITQARDFLVDYLRKNPCVDCGNADIRVLEFDHRPGVERVNGVAVLAGRGYALDVIKAEIEKCDVRCRNCHTIKTYERRGGTWHDDYIQLHMGL